MYLEGLQQEGIIQSDGGSAPQEQPQEVGKPVKMGPTAVDLSRVDSREVHLTSVNWAPPEGSGFE